MDWRDISVSCIKKERFAVFVKDSFRQHQLKLQQYCNDVKFIINEKSDGLCRLAGLIKK